MILIFCFFIIILINHQAFSQLITDESLATEYLESVNLQLAQMNEQMAFAQWNFSTNITEDNQKRMLEETFNYNNLQKEIWLNTTKFNFSDFKNKKVQQQYKVLSILGIPALQEEQQKRFANLSSELEKLYSGTTACVNNKCNLEIEPDLTQILAKSRNYSVLTEAWTNWHNNAGRPLRKLYLEYVKLGNEAAEKNGFKTLDDLWMFEWDTSKHDFKNQLEQIWKEIEPIYKKVHAYVRMKLAKKYGEMMPSDGTIPAHLLGNMWAQTWNNILDLVAPFPNKSLIDVTDEMVRQNYTALRMFQLSDNFYKDLGMIGMPQQFWDHSMIEKPTDRKVVCHASAWDFFNKNDFRVKMCTEVTMEDLITIHHEMGHIEYYLQYKDQPVVFREGANPGFHEAIGDLMALSVSTPAHLQKIGLLNNLTDDNETLLNFQMNMALQKLVFIPFSYILDQWRWDLFSGQTNSSAMNRRWWQLRLKYQGVSPPVKRSEEDCDACAKYHVPAGVEYIRYFVAAVIQFSFHKSLCGVAQPNVPLFKCDIDANKEVGKKFAQMMQLGSSVSWPEQLEMITGRRQMSAQAMIEYFEPLISYIDGQIQNENIGWQIDENKYFESNASNNFDERLTKIEESQRSLLTRLEQDESKIERLEADLIQQKIKISKLDKREEKKIL